ncbi:bacteriohemerythrin [Geobacter sp. AOG1]|uniref:bacteriohemerythrin n=1 Tax=Geobacter sp. AOG1 TaxID=1566346 RepID=UPI001CC64180|nr:bacteriohemerythrin [Geobacter sp. AOG1]GFE57160.1 hemerythrin [Geobacter sp. AOG1]
MGVEWRPELAINVAEIDKQHQELFRRFDELLKACDSGQGQKEIARLLDFLDDYVRTHFRDEERIQANSNFPGYTEHRRQHQQFVSRLNDLKRQLATDGASLPVILQTNHMMVDWLINHISKLDRQIGDYLAAKAGK